MPHTHWDRKRRKGGEKKVCHSHKLPSSKIRKKSGHSVSNELNYTNILGFCLFSALECKHFGVMCMCFVFGISSLSLFILAGLVICCRACRQCHSQCIDSDIWLKTFFLPISFFMWILCGAMQQPTVNAN